VQRSVPVKIPRVQQATDFDERFHDRSLRDPVQRRSTESHVLQTTNVNNSFKLIPLPLFVIDISSKAWKNASHADV
jgi:hypothetical protein